MCAGLFICCALITNSNLRVENQRQFVLVQIKEEIKLELLLNYGIEMSPCSAHSECGREYLITVWSRTVLLLLECVALISPTINFYCESKHIKLLIYYFATRARARRGRQAVRNFNVTRAQENLKMRKYMSKSSLVYRPGRNIAGQFTTLYLYVHCVWGNRQRAEAKKN
jgi:hypothetical protein